ncbi:TKL protein kinase [Saprolegnia diclina VS20]|uniref:TKL protein kinase n=1 Tax=Saprolegnia diclina (strain VS20) TaxID=1156394 RepID=T0QSH4_SAPDV|nr:TKL protein kinase [Saprolegnia diclina VS20]EQC37656.1 TKL protein kinase [Saprolegnia diclina VS20]|eukprot:XP_008609176.1 TKL protein kinase [Saprolegnia diclina VS20]
MAVASYTLYGACEGHRNSSSSSSAGPCLVAKDGNGTLTSVEAANGVVNLQNASISDVASFPPTATVVDLSMNAIAQLGSDPVPALRLLNLSHNEFRTTDALPRFAALQTLDLSYNAIAYVGNLTLALPSVTRLSLANNRITALRNPTFPLSLQSLDLSGNTMTTFDVSSATFRQLNALPYLSLGNFSITACSGALHLLRSSVVCVLDSDTPPSTLLMTAYGQLIMVLSCIGLFVFAYLVCAKRVLDSPGPPANQHLRDTCLSSAYSIMEDDPMEYRISLSIEMDTKPFETILFHDTRLMPLQMAMKDIKKLKLLSSTAYTMYVAERHGAKVHATMLTPCTIEDTPTYLGGLVHEIAFLARLSHPNIVPLLGFATSSSLLDLTVVTEFMALGSLADVLRDANVVKYLRWTTPTNGVVPPKAQLALDVATAVAHLHALDAPVLHNAISLDHVFVSSEWRAHLGAFMYASYLDEPKTILAPQAAPEVVANGLRSTHSDVYLVGRLIADLEVANDMPETVRAIVVSCTALEPTARPSALEVATRLHHCLSSANTVDATV